MRAFTSIRESLQRKGSLDAALAKSRATILLEPISKIPLSFVPQFLRVFFKSINVSMHERTLSWKEIKKSKPLSFS